MRKVTVTGKFGGSGGGGGGGSRMRSGDHDGEITHLRTDRDERAINLPHTHSGLPSHNRTSRWTGSRGFKEHDLEGHGRLLARGSGQRWACLRARPKSMRFDYVFMH